MESLSEFSDRNRINDPLRISLEGGLRMAEEKGSVQGHWRSHGSRPRCPRPENGHFRKGVINILVATTVIEVGVDIPNATLMIIAHAERFGLAQLHQFRGRVGRSKYQSFCFLFTDSPAKKTQERLKALITSENGFELAEKDLEIRGPGALNGSRQWGIPDFAMASLKDMFLVQKN